MLIFHIVVPGKAVISDDMILTTESLESEGFIHCSYEHQLDGVIERYYSDEPRLVILKISANKLKSKWVSEPSTGGEEYPHVYGPINLNAVVHAEVRKKEAKQEA